MYKIILFLGLAFCLGCGEKEGSLWRTYKGSTMGTSFSIKYELPKGLSHEPLEREIDQILTTFDLLLSNWNPKSWVTQFNGSEGMEWEIVDPIVIDILEVAKWTHDASGGVFDVTISPLIEWWGFGASEPKESRDAVEKKLILDEIGMGKLDWSRNPNQIKKKRSQIQINCSAVAKGFGVDLVSNHLSKMGIKNYMVEIGGEVRVMGIPQGRETWVLGIRRPDSKGNPVFARVKMKSGLSLATSGDYLNAFEEKGRRYSHIIDPRNGEPVTHNLTSVTVLGKDCAAVDALATACMVLGEKEGRRAIEKLEGFEAFFITRFPSGFETSMTDGFPFLAD